MMLRNVFEQFSVVSLIGVRLGGLDISITNVFVIMLVVMLVVFVLVRGVMLDGGTIVSG